MLEVSMLTKASSSVDSEFESLDQPCLATHFKE